MSSMVNTPSFAGWLQAQMDERGMTQSELARQSGVTRAAINNILTSTRGPGIDLCKGLARALKLPPEEVYRAADILPKAPTVDVIAKTITHLMQSLTPEDKREVLEFVRLKVRLAEKNNGHRRTKPSESG